MDEEYDEMVRKYEGRTLTKEEKKSFAKEVQKILKPIFIERDKTPMNDPCSNFRF